MTELRFSETAAANLRSIFPFLSEDETWHY
jgi:hypothetical protein